ncbi:MAG: Gfo/Idh/MocA family oxidoreductase [Victivallales bacterium]|nr:Gfo/Idh/MocA family oxidoreductase [Victivallales bacterium]
MTTTTTDRPIALGFIGVANMGTTNLKEFLKEEDARVVALCDVDAGHLAKAKALVDEHNGDDTCLTFHDFRDLNACPDVDAVVVTTPDHWHALQAIDAMENGKDVYCEKPLTLSIAEGRAICNAVERTGRILQTGTQQRSSAEFRRACELVRNGALGELQTIETEIPPNNKECEPTWEPMPVPEGFDYDFWLGPAPAAEYHEQRCHYQFRFVRDYSGGQVTNFGAHHVDIAQWALGMDESGPVAARGQGEFPESGLFSTATKVDFTLTYANGVEVRCITGGSKVTFIGSAGRLMVGRGKLEADPASILDFEIPEDGVHLYESANHYANFLECIRTRQQPVSPAEVGHRSATCCHLANIAMLLGRELKWDPASERFPDDAEADAMRLRPYRAPWMLKV